MLRAVWFSALLVGLSGCSPWEQESKYLERITYGTVRTGGNGVAEIRFPLPEDFSSSKVLFRFDNLEEGQTVFVSRVDGENGSIVRNFASEVEIGEYSTGAVSRQRQNHFNWPIDASDPAMPADELRVNIAAVSSDGETLSAGSDIGVEAIITDDGGFESGRLRVFVHWTADLEQDPELRASVDAALVKMQDIYWEFGVEVTVEERTQDDFSILAEGAVARPGFGTPDTWSAITASTDELALDLVLVDTISGSDPAVLGAAGSVPGGILPTPRSGVIISTAANAGPDLVYSESEVDLLGATFAHEIGHMLGLFHPVELTYERWDAVDDTPNCQGETGCQARLGENLMYATALCTASDCVEQEALTEGQIAILQRYVGVN